MKTRLLSALLIFLLVASVSVPAVSAEPSHVYYELHNMCLCNAEENLGQIRGSWGIGYEACVIDEQNDKWKVFVHAGDATKEITITSETDLGKLVMLRDFVTNVDECKEESNQIPINVGAAIGAGTGGAAMILKGVLTDDAVFKMSGVAGITASAEEVRQTVIHFNNAKTAQKNAETLFEVL